MSIDIFWCGYKMGAMDLKTCANDANVTPIIYTAYLCLVSFCLNDLKSSINSSQILAKSAASGEIFGQNLLLKSS